MYFLQEDGCGRDTLQKGGGDSNVSSSFPFEGSETVDRRQVGPTEAGMD